MICAISMPEIRCALRLGTSEEINSGEPELNGENCVKQIYKRGFDAMMAVWVFMVLGAIPVPPCVAQEKTPTQSAGVDNTKMGAYRALAQLSFRAFQKGDNATSAELARILERSWDAAEEGGGEHSLAKTNSERFGQIDEAMDAFIKPILRYASKTPDPVGVESAYNEYLNKLKEGDR